MAYRPRAPAPFSSPPPARSIAPFALNNDAVSAPISSGANSYAFLSATGTTGRPGGNAAALASPPTATAFREAFCAFENGAVPIDTFRARLNALGISETPEATRLLSQPTRIGFAALSVALRRGGAEDGLTIPSAGFGPGGGPAGARARSTVVESDIESNCRATSKAREDRSTAQIESGAGLLLRGLGDTLPQNATTDSVPNAPFSMKTATASQYRVGDHEGVSNEAETIRMRARSLLATVEGGTLREYEATARFVDAGLFPAAIPGLATSLRCFFNGGRLDTVNALRAVDVWILERLPSSSSFSSTTDALKHSGMGTFRGNQHEKSMGSSLPITGILPSSHEPEPVPSPDRYAAQRAKMLGETTLWRGDTKADDPFSSSYKQAHQNEKIVQAPYNVDTRAMSAAEQWGRPLGGPLSPHSGPQKRDTAERAALRLADAQEMKGQIERGKNVRAESGTQSLIGEARTALHNKATAGYQFRL